MFRLICTDKFSDFTVFKDIYPFKRMAGDKTILTDHERKIYIFMFGNFEGNHTIIVCFLSIFSIDLHPAGVPFSH